MVSLVNTLKQTPRPWLAAINSSGCSSLPGFVGATSFTVEQSRLGNPNSTLFQAGSSGCGYFDSTDGERVRVAVIELARRLGQPVLR